MDTITHKKGSYHVFRTTDRRFEHLNGSVVQIIRVIYKPDRLPMYDIAVVQSPSNGPSREGQIVEVFHDELKELESGRLVCHAERTSTGFSASYECEYDNQVFTYVGVGATWDEMIADILRVINDIPGKEAIFEKEEITNKDIFVILR